MLCLSLLLVPLSLQYDLPDRPNPSHLVPAVHPQYTAVPASTSLCDSAQLSTHVLSRAACSRARAVEVRAENPPAVYTGTADRPYARSATLPRFPCDHRRSLTYDSRFRFPGRSLTHPKLGKLEYKQRCGGRVLTRSTLRSARRRSTSTTTTTRTSPATVSSALKCLEYRTP